MRRLFVTLVALMAAVPAAAQSAGEPAFPTARIAFVDLDRAAVESALGKALRSRLEAFEQARAVEADGRNAALRAEERKLRESGAALTGAARRDLNRKISTFRIDLQRFVEDAQADYASLQQEAEREFELRLAPAIQQVAEQNALGFVFLRPSAGLLWAAAAFDVTDAVIRELDRVTD